MPQTYDDGESSFAIDSYPYTFSPLLLFAPGEYFDKGHSNYASVARFFAPVLGEVDMMENVLHDRKNMLYEELLAYVTDHRMLVTCCIDSHFTAFQVVGEHHLLYYDPMSSALQYVDNADSYRKLVCYLLLKCNYADNSHLVDHKAHYTSHETGTPLRRTIYTLWRDINKTEPANVLYGCRSRQIGLRLDRFLLVNDARNHRAVGTQLTGCTCYFQTYLFGLLCKVGDVAVARDGQGVDVRAADKLEGATVRVATFLLEFFVKHGPPAEMRPLSNSNVVVDFHRHRDAAYYGLMTKYLASRGAPVPAYAEQLGLLMGYYRGTRVLHRYARCSLDTAMSATPNTKSLQPVCDADADAVVRLCRASYYKYRAATLMFGFNTGITGRIGQFCELNALRKNQLLRFYEELEGLFRAGAKDGRHVVASGTKYRDYYFMASFEAGQRELCDVHAHCYELDMAAMARKGDAPSEAAAVARQRVQLVNKALAEHVHASTFRTDDYHKILKHEQFMKTKAYETFVKAFMSCPFFHLYCGLGFVSFNPKDKDINCLTQTVIYSCDMMSQRSWRQDHEFEKEAVNQMAQRTLRGHTATFTRDGQSEKQGYSVQLKIGFGYTYSKYNTLMHFLTVAQHYWHNPDLNAIQLFGKDIRAVLGVACQKVFFDDTHSGGWYHYGPFEMQRAGYYGNTDLQVGVTTGEAPPYVSRDKSGGKSQLIVTDRVFEGGYLTQVLTSLCAAAKGARLKSDDVVLNLSLLSLLLDFGLAHDHASLLNLPFLQSLAPAAGGGAVRFDARQLQVEVSNWLSEFDRKNSADAVTRAKVEGLIFELSYKFLVNKNLSSRAQMVELLQSLNSDPVYHQYVLLVKVYLSLCQINKSAEVDYYKLFCDGAFRIVIPQDFSPATSDYLEATTTRYTFSERNGVISYGGVQIFDVRSSTPHVDLYKVRFDVAPPDASSMVTYIEVSNVFRAVGDGTGAEQYLIFIADNALVVECGDKSTIKLNSVVVEAATIFFNDAVSFVPCFKYADSDDVILFCSPQIRHHVDTAGQFDVNYYGMKHELIDCITSEQLYVDLNDEYVFKAVKLTELVGESKTVLFFPDYQLQAQSPTQLISLLDQAIKLRNISFFVLVLLYLRRCSIDLQFLVKDRDSPDVVKITGPWLAAIRYALNKASNPSYDALFSAQFFDLNSSESMDLAPFIDTLADNFTKYQRSIDGGYQIVPTAAQKAFLRKIITAEECLHFSEVGSGKTKVILPLLCQAFLSNNQEAHRHLARGGAQKYTLVVLVPEHLLADAKAQVFRYCLNLNFRDEYKVHDDIFALLHDEVRLYSGSSGPSDRRPFGGLSKAQTRPPHKAIFVTTFNLFKKALTYDKICRKMRPHREHVLVVCDEVDDFLDRDKLVFNICSNMANSFQKPTLECYYELSRGVYRGEAPSYFFATASTPSLSRADNKEYWRQLREKWQSIHAEVQEQSRSLNKAFGIFNEQTLRHCRTNVAQDVEGYKGLIARPYESVNRAMPGSYYSDAERTIYLTYYLLMEDISKYDELFQQQRKFISYEFFAEHVGHLEYDDLVYGTHKLSELVAKVPQTKEGLTRFLYEIILRRMEIRDRSRSVNSVDVIFNFDVIGFTGTPFVDNYPTFGYIRSGRQDAIPDLIERSFYAYSSEALDAPTFDARFTAFQGRNHRVLASYCSSDFLQAGRSGGKDELALLAELFARERRAAGGAAGGGGAPAFNVLVDLCGLVKKASIHAVRDLVVSAFGAGAFSYVYHIHPADGGDRVLSTADDADVPYDEEFYNHLCATHGAKLRERVFFFVDNRNVIGKDVPFQLVHQKRFGEPLFQTSVVLAHDVDDFSKIWQAMGRSRTMNDTQFRIYKSDLPSDLDLPGGELRDIKAHALTRTLYVRNCDRKMAGNLSSIYQTLVALYNLSQDSFYHSDEIVNVFIEKMERTIGGKVAAHETNLARCVVGQPVPHGILSHILGDKFRRAANAAVSGAALTPELVRALLHHIVTQKYEQRAPTGDAHDAMLAFLCGEQEEVMEISYTKQQQKQKQKQSNKDQDADTMQAFDRKHQLTITADMDDYYLYSRTPAADLPRQALALPLSVPIFALSYADPADGATHVVSVYPTLQFLYSHHVRPEYISAEVRELMTAEGLLPSRATVDPDAFCRRFLDTVEQAARAEAGAASSSAAANGSHDANGGAHDGAAQLLNVRILRHLVRQAPQYSLAALQKGVYVIGMKEQFNMHDLPSHPLAASVQYVADEMGFVLYCKPPPSMVAQATVSSFGPYFVEQYLLMETLSKQEVAQNVLEYYVHRRDALQHALDTYSEAQGKGFVCWRFIHERSRSTGPSPSPSSLTLSELNVSPPPARA